MSFDRSVFRDIVTLWSNHMPIRQITIIGTGLIGGSLGLALKKQQLRRPDRRLRPRPGAGAGAGQGRDR